MEPQEDLKFGKAAVSLGMITSDQLAKCLEFQKQLLSGGENVSLSGCFLKKGFLKPSQVSYIHQQYTARPAPTGSFPKTERQAVPNKFGRYEVLGEIGRGGMGVVYKARDPRLDRTLALKILLGKSEMEVDRFLREAKATAKLRHPNIVNLYDTGQEEGQHFFTMDFVDGVTLDRFAKESQPGMRQITDIMLKVCEAIYYAHREGIIHRDLKPGNIMVTKDGEPKIMDFGLAKVANESKQLSKSGMVIGTLLYMPPEQAEGKIREIDERSDIYSLGAILYELLTGRTPFSTGSYSVIMRQIVHKDPIPPSDIKKTVPPDLESICLKALEKKKELRYQSVPSLMDELSRYRRGEVVEAKPMRAWRRIVRKARRHRTLAALVILAFACLVAGGTALGIWKYVERENYIKETIAKSAQILKNTIPAKDLEKRYRLASNLERPLPQDAQRSISAAIHTCMEARALLDKALWVDPNSRKIKKQLADIDKEIGSLALLARDYVLSQIFFEQYQKSGNKKEAEQLIKLVKDRREQAQNDQVRRIKEIMAELGGGVPEEGMVEEYALEIAKMQGEHAVKELLSSLDSAGVWQRLTAIRALGQIGDSRTKLRDKDVLEELLARLFQVDIKVDVSEAVELVWALGRLKDGRANEAVHKVRQKAGRSSIFWQRTELPYRWIPMEGEGSNAEDFNRLGEMKAAKGDFAGAVAEFSHAIAGDPRLAKAYNNRGRALCMKERLNDLQMNEHNREVSNPLVGASRERRDNIEQARSDFTRAIELDPQFADPHINRATLRHIIGDVDGALSDYARALELDPEDLKIYQNLGTLYLSRGDYDKAIDIVSQSLEKQPDAVAYSNRGIAHYMKKEPREAMEDFDRSIAIKPTSMAFANRALLYIQQGRIDDAIADLTRGIEIDPKNEMAYSNRGVLHLKSNHLQAAMADYTQVIQLDPGHALAYSQRGYIHARSGSFEQALADCNRAVAIAPDRGDIYYDRGRVFGMIGQSRRSTEYLKKALDDFSKAIDLDPKFGEAYLKRAELYGLFEKPEEALADYGRALGLAPQDGEIYARRAKIYLMLENHESAIADLTRAVRLLPDDPEVYQLCAFAYYMGGQTEQAKSHVEKAIELGPKDPQSYMLRGTLLRDEGKLGKALKDYDQAIGLDPGSAESYFYRGMLRHLQCHFREAIEDFNKIVSLVPDSARVYAHRAIAYHRCGDVASAMADCKKALEISPGIPDDCRRDALQHQKKGIHQVAAYQFEIYLLLVPNAPDARKIKDYIAKHGK